MTSEPWVRWSASPVTVAQALVEVGAGASFAQAAAHAGAGVSAWSVGRWVARFTPAVVWALSAPLWPPRVWADVWANRVGLVVGVWDVDADVPLFAAPAQQGAPTVPGVWSAMWSAARVERAVGVTAVPPREVSSPWPAAVVAARTLADGRVGLVDDGASVQRRPAAALVGPGRASAARAAAVVKLEVLRAAHLLAVAAVAEVVGQVMGGAPMPHYLVGLPAPTLLAAPAGLWVAPPKLWVPDVVTANGPLFGG